MKKGTLIKTFLGSRETKEGQKYDTLSMIYRDENGVKMPSFFGYIWWSLRYLIPVFIIDTLLFFL